MNSVAHHWSAQPLLCGSANPENDQPVINPARPQDQPGSVAAASAEDVEVALAGAAPWQASANDRAPHPERGRRSVRGAFRRIVHPVGPRSWQVPARRSCRAERGCRFPALLRRQHSRRRPRWRLYLYQPVELPAGHLHRPDFGSIGDWECRVGQTSTSDPIDRASRRAIAS